MKIRVLLLIIFLPGVLIGCISGRDQAPSTSRPTPLSSNTALLITPDLALPVGGCPKLGSQLVYDKTLPRIPDNPRSYIGYHYNELAMPEGLTFEAAELLNSDVDVSEFRLS